VFNTSYTSLVSVTAVYRCFLGACPGTAPQVTFVLGERESRAFDDMIRVAFNAPSSAGAVELTSSGDSVRVTSRLYSPEGDERLAAGVTGGTNGMFVPGMKSSQAHGVSVLTGLSNGLFRTNVGAFNPHDSMVVATVKLFNGGALLGTIPLPLQPRSGNQANIFIAVGQAGLVTTNAYAVVESGSSGVDLFTYAAVIDNATADSSFVSGEEDLPAPAGPAPSSQTINVTLRNYSFSPGSSQPLVVTAGTSTTLIFEAAEGNHGFSGVSTLGLAGTNNISAGMDDDPYYGGGRQAVIYTVTFTPPVSARGSTFDFWCTAHPSNMRGTLRVD
jgi:acyl dehydratase